MSWLRDRKQRKEYEKAKADYDWSLVSWEALVDEVDTMLYAAENLDALFETTAESGASIRLNSGENLVVHVANCVLIEPRSGGGSYQGGSTGVSFRVAKGVRFRVGQHKGTFVANPEVNKVIDDGGDIYVTDQRVIYSSTSRNREWKYGSLLNVMHDPSGITYMQVSNRQKVSGFGYGQGIADQVRNRITLALAIYDDEVDHLVEDLREQRDELSSAKPEPPAPPALP